MLKTLNPKRKKLSKKQKGVYLFVALLLVYPLLQWGVNWLYLNIRTIVLTFQKYNVATGKYEFWGFEAYKRIFRDLFTPNSGLQTAFKNSYRAIYLNIIITVLSVFCSYCLYKKMPGEMFFRVVFMLPTIISAVVLTTLYRNLLSSDFGPLAKLFDLAMGKEHTSYLSTENNYLWGLIELYCIWMGLGNSVLLSSTAMFRIPAEVIESAMLDGRGLWRRIYKNRVAADYAYDFHQPSRGVFGARGIDDAADADCHLRAANRINTKRLRGMCSIACAARNRG